jgi:histidine kinase
VSVTDTGPGIAPDKLGQIFEPFVQLGIPTLDGLGGSGLGLPISREFAVAMGGELAASSDGRGHGSTFTLRLLRDRLSRRPRQKHA